jgi:hypothetical protein
MTATIRRVVSWLKGCNALKQPPVVLSRAARLFSKERDLRMVWKVAKRGRHSVLAGTAHFFPYRFRQALREHIGAASTVVLEGPLDDAARRKVVSAGSGRRGASLYDALDAATLRKLEQALGAAARPPSGSALLWELLHGGPASRLSNELRPLEPWMAFFHIWTELRTRDGWIYSMDLDAARIAAGLGKDVRYLETIEEQIETLERVPLQRWVDFLKRADWDAYRRDYVRCFLEGDLAALTALAQGFPTFCAPVIEQRDPVLLERMLPFLERGNAAAFVGITHCRGLIALLQARGYRVTQGRPRGGPQPH